MVVSKPIYSLAGFYLEQLFYHPVRTKSVTSSVLAASANYTSQCIAGKGEKDKRSIFAYGLYGFLVGGTVPHYFYKALEKIFPQDMKCRKIYQFLAERLLYAPFNQFLSLYTIARFEGKSHQEAVKSLVRMFWPLLRTNWLYLSTIAFLNIFFVPPVFRTVLMSFVGFIWAVYMAGRRRQMQKDAESK